jgi:hypothetical protein
MTASIPSIFISPLLTKYALYFDIVSTRTLKKIVIRQTERQGNKEGGKSNDSDIIQIIRHNGVADFLQNGINSFKIPQI